MFYLIATILLNVLLFVIFKLFSRYKIDGFQAIVFNYLTCVITGSVYIGRFPVGADSIAQPWFAWSLALGGCFIGLFNFLAYCSRVEGMTTTAIANKLSLVIPVLFSLFLYNETAGVGKIAGIVLALPAVYFATKKEAGTTGVRMLWLPALLFLASGLLDTLVKFVEEHYLSDLSQQAVYVIHCFATAGLLGAILLIILFLTGRKTFAIRNVIAGVALGIPNFFSIYYLVRLLHSDVFQSSAAIAVNNIGIVLVSSLVAIFFFREKSSWPRIFGIILSLAAILLIALSDQYGF
jgi:drug/metabolite transporter (DMT)-like permease